MSQVTELASAQLTATDQLVIELIEAAETPAAVIIRWPEKPTVSIPDASPTQRPGSRGSSPRPRHGSPRSGRGGGKGKQASLVPSYRASS